MGAVVVREGVVFLLVLNSEGSSASSSQVRNKGCSPPHLTSFADGVISSADVA